MPLTQNDLQQIKTIVVEVVDSKLEEKLKPIHKKLNKLQKDLDTTIRYFDHEVLDLKKRVDRLEDSENPPVAL